MIPILIGNKKVNIKSGYYELSYNDIQKLMKAEDIYQKLASISDAIEEDFKNVNEDCLLPFIQWLADKIEIKKDIESILIKSVYVDITKDIRHYTFRQYRLVKRLFIKDLEKESNDINFEILEIILRPVYEGSNVYREDKELTKEFIEILKELSYVDLLSVYAKISKNISELINRDTRLYRRPDPKHLLAGVDKLNKFGDSYTIDKLTGNDITKIDAVVDMEYEEVFMKMLRDVEMSDYEKRLETIHKQQ